MPRTIRDTIKDKRSRIYGAIDKIYAYLLDINELGRETSEQVDSVTTGARDLTAMYEQGMKELLGGL